MDFRSAQVIRITVLTLLAGLLACQAVPEPRRYSVRGVVKQLTPERNRLKIAHEEIPGFMAAMTMELEVREPVLLTGLRPGDAIIFTLEYTPESLYVVAIEPSTDTTSQIVQHALPDEAASAIQNERQNQLNRSQPAEALATFTPFPAPDFLLTDQDAQPLVLSSLRGKVILMDFIFTQCPGPCPILSTKFSHVQRRLGERLGKDVMLLSVTIDPRRDTPDVLKAYAKRYKADLSGWKFLTGSTRDILVVATQYGAEYQGGSDGILDHRLRTCVINQEGMLVQVFDGVNHTVNELLVTVEQLLA